MSPLVLYSYLLSAWYNDAAAHVCRCGLCLICALLLASLIGKSNYTMGRSCRSSYNSPGQACPHTGQACPHTGAPVTVGRRTSGNHHVGAMPRGTRSLPGHAALLFTPDRRRLLVRCAVLGFPAVLRIEALATPRAVAPCQLALHDYGAGQTPTTGDNTTARLVVGRPNLPDGMSSHGVACATATATASSTPGAMPSRQCCWLRMSRAARRRWLCGRLRPVRMLPCYAPVSGLKEVQEGRILAHSSAYGGGDVHSAHAALANV